MLSITDVHRAIKIQNIGLCTMYFVMLNEIELKNTTTNPKKYSR